jgi:voltage-gated potassium channel Kch
MAKMIYDQRNINGLSDEQLQKVMGVGSEELKRLSVQESINKSIEKMTEALAGPLEMLAQMLFTGEKLKIVFGLVAGILAGRMVSSLVTAAASVAATVISARAYNSAIKQGLTTEAALTAMKVAGAEAMSFGTVTAAIVGGLATVLGATAAFASMAKTPGLAAGGTVLGEGSVMVGEKGPEVLSLKPGATVTPLNKVNAAKERSSDFNSFLDKIVDRISEGMSRANITTSVKVDNREIAIAAAGGALVTAAKTQ